MHSLRAMGLALLVIAAHPLAQSTWTPVRSGTSLRLNSVTWAGNQLVVLCGQDRDGFYDTLLTSPDGLTWTPRVTGASLIAVTWTGSQYVAVGSGGSRILTNAYRGLAYTSPDGATWGLSATDVASNFCTGLFDVAWTGSRLVAVGATTEIATSTDAAHWTTWMETSTRISGAISRVVWAGTHLVAFGYEDRGGGASGVDNFILTSPDGSDWTRIGEFTTLAPASVLWTGSEIIGVGGENLMRSKEGLAWTTRRIAPGKNLRAVAWTGQRIVAVTAEYPATILYSQDGTTWSEKTLTAAITGLAWTGKRLVAVGLSGQILVSEEDPVPILPRPKTRPQARSPRFGIGGAYSATGRVRARVPGNPE
jgi:hypothetical protein